MYGFLLFMNDFALPLYPSLFSSNMSVFLGLVFYHLHTATSYFSFSVMITPPPIIRESFPLMYVALMV